MNYAVFNLKLVSTLSAGALVAMITFVSNKNTGELFTPLLAGYIKCYLLVLLISVICGMLLYIYGEASFEQSEKDAIDALERDSSNTKDRERLMKGLAAVIAGLHVLAVILFFWTGFSLANNLVLLAQVKPQ